jgi:hypothetical protein
MNPMNDPVYRAIATLCDLKGFATYAEVASVAGVKKQKAVDYLLRNKHLLKMNKKGQITGFISHESNVRRIVEGMFTMGKVYKLQEVNYGADKAVVVADGYFEKVKHLVETYFVGGFGDCYKTEYIILRENTHEKMVELGFRYFEDVVKGKLEAGSDQVWHDWCVP